MRRRAGRRTGPVLAIYLRGEPYHRVVVEVSDPENLSRDINDAIGTSLRPRVAATNLLIGNTRAPRRGSPIDNTAVYLAGGLWVRVFHSGRFPGGATGCRLDHEAALRRADEVSFRRRKDAHRRRCTSGRP